MSIVNKLFVQSREGSPCPEKNKLVFFSVMSLTTGSSSIFPSTSVLLWPSLAVFCSLLKGEIPLQCRQNHGGPNPTIYQTELLKATPHSVSCYFNAQKDTVNAFPLMLWWAFSSMLSPRFFLTTLPGLRPFSRSHEGLFIHTDDGRRISSQRSDGRKNMTSISAPRHVATS